MGETYRSVDLNTALTCPHMAPLQPGHKGLRVRVVLLSKYGSASEEIGGGSNSGKYPNACKVPQNSFAIKT